MSCPPVNDARIEQRIDEVEDKRSQSDGDDQDEDDPLHQEEVRALDALEKQGSDPGIPEDDFHKYRSGDQLTEYEGKGSCLRQHGVADAVIQKDRPALKALGLCKEDI